MVKHSAPKTTFGSLQNPDHVSNAVIFHSSFSPEGAHNYCIITPGADRFRLRVFDTATGNLKNDYEEKEGDGKWTCVRWGHITEVSVCFFAVVAVTVVFSCCDRRYGLQLNITSSLSNCTMH